MTGEAHGQRSSKEDWLKAAIRLLVEDGIDQVKVMELARRLGVGRSSFYWFFESLSDLQDELLAFWRARNTGAITERAARPSATIIEAMLNVFECWVDPRLFDPQLDMAIRLWARRSPEVRDAVRRSDDERLEAVAAMFRRHGFPAEDARIRARVLYFTQVGHYALEIDESMAVRHLNLVPYLRAFSGQEPTAEEIARFEAWMAENDLFDQ